MVQPTLLTLLGTASSPHLMCELRRARDRAWYSAIALWKFTAVTNYALPPQLLAASYLLRHRLSPYVVRRDMQLNTDSSFWYCLRCRPASPAAAVRGRSTIRGCLRSLIFIVFFVLCFLPYYLWTIAWAVFQRAGNGSLCPTFQSSRGSFLSSAAEKRPMFLMLPLLFGTELYSSHWEFCSVLPCIFLANSVSLL